jgi:hypothetical protein
MPSLQNVGLGQVDLKKVAGHFLIYLVGYGLLAAFSYLAKVNFGQYTTLVVLVIGMLTNIVQKLLDGVKE